MTLSDTIGNEQWLRENEAKIRALLPTTWTLITNLTQRDMLKIGWELKLLGVDWRSTDEFGKVMIYFEKLGILLRKDYCVRANPRSIFA